MLTIKKRIAEQIVSGVRTINADAELSVNDVAAMLEYPPDPNMGDLAFPCFKLSKTLRRAPAQIASAIAEHFSDPAVSRVEVVGGYFNLYLDGEYLTCHLLSEVSLKKDRYGSPANGDGRVVVFDYSSPNLAKPFHIGHLGTTVIGHSLRRLHEFAGYRCVGINYVGDWGTQFGKLIVAYKKWGDRETVENGGVDALVDLYVRINNAISGNEELGIPADPALADSGDFAAMLPITFGTNDAGTITVRNPNTGETNSYTKAQWNAYLGGSPWNPGQGGAWRFTLAGSPSGSAVRFWTFCSSTKLTAVPPEESDQPTNL